MHDQAECADGIGCEWDDQLRHEPKLDGGHCSRELHDQQLHHIAERNLNRNRNRHVVCRERPFSLDRLQFYRRSDGRCWYVGRKFSRECDDARWRRIGMRNGMERHCGLHPRHDGKRGRRKLRREFLDTEPESVDQQRRRWQWTTLDCDRPLFNLLGRASHSDWIGGVRDHQLQHKLELECSYPTRRVQCQLQGTAGRNLDRKPNHNIRCSDWSHALDYLQLHS
jgi:hypothetical protein